MPTGSSECKKCPVGHFAGAVSQTQCLPCVGGVANATGSTACTPCGPGQFIAERGRGYGCTTCGPGKGPTPNRTSCVDCNALEVWACGVCLGCSPPKIKLDNNTCLAPSTRCRPGTSPQNHSASERNSSGSCDADQRCSQCLPGRVSSDGSKGVTCSDGNKVANLAQIACVSCGPGAEPNADRSKCVKYKRFHFSSDGVQCQLCRGDYIVSKDRSSCTPCPAGRGAKANQTRCELCPVGKYSSTGVCQKCLPGPNGQTIAASVGSVVCRNCPAGKVAHVNAQECQCAVGNYNISAMVVLCFSREYLARGDAIVQPTDRSECQPCEPCLDCTNVGSVVVKNGYRLRPGESSDRVTVHVELGLSTIMKPRQLMEHHVFMCPYQASCKTGYNTMNSTCLLGHTGILCQSCASGWSRLPNGSCFDCNTKDR